MPRMRSSCWKLVWETVPRVWGVLPEDPLEGGKGLGIFCRTSVEEFSTCVNPL